MKNLKDLNKQQCVKIASIAEPQIEWELVFEESKWEGFDLIDKGSKPRYAKYIFQIDYRSEKELMSKPRFRFYEDLHEFDIPKEKIAMIERYISKL